MEEKEIESIHVYNDEEECFAEIKHYKGERVRMDADSLSEMLEILTNVI